MADGSLYHGQIKQGKRHGYGILMNNDGYYDGYWHNDKATGSALFQYYGGEIYKGMWKDD